MTLWWSVAAVLQAIGVAIAGWRLWRSGGNIILGVVFIALGGIIIAANLAWLVTGGPDGRSSILMRGGWFGFWLATLTAVEIVALGVVAMVLALPWIRRESS